jgi:subtilisin family serine protease
MESQWLYNTSIAKVRVALGNVSREIVNNGYALSTLGVVRVHLDVPTAVVDEEQEQEQERETVSAPITSASRGASKANKPSAKKASVAQKPQQQQQKGTTIRVFDAERAVISLRSHLDKLAQEIVSLSSSSTSASVRKHKRTDDAADGVDGSDSTTTRRLQAYQGWRDPPKLVIHVVQNIRFYALLDGGRTTPTTVPATRRVRFKAEPVLYFPATNSTTRSASSATAHKNTRNKNNKRRRPVGSSSSSSSPSSASVPISASIPWHLDRINQIALPLDQDGSLPDLLWNPDFSSAWVYCVDTGIYASHPEFDGSRVEFLHDQHPQDPQRDSHGTHVASLIAGKTVGVNPRARLFDVRALDSDGTASYADVIESLTAVYEHCTAHGGKQVRTITINMSFGGSGTPQSPSGQALGSILSQLRNDCGAIIVAAAGNEYTSASSILPASLIAPEQGGVLAVGATGSNDAFASFSNYGPVLFINAPGVGILGAWGPSNYASLSGTSMAAPIVAGAASIHATRYPSYTWATERPGELFADLVKTKLAVDAVGAVHSVPRGTTVALLRISPAPINPSDTPLSPAEIVLPISSAASTLRSHALVGTTTIAAAATSTSLLLPALVVFTLVFAL